MSVEAVKILVREVMSRDFTIIPTPSGKGDRVHLEVWENKRSGIPVGLEMGRSTLVNLWLVRGDVPMGLPLTIKRVDKDPDGDGWTDGFGDGANHNLKHYRQFAGRPITRLCLTNLSEAEQVLSLLTKNEVHSLAQRAKSGTRADAFLLKINGLEHAPGGICRPKSADAWSGGVLSLPSDFGNASCRFDMSPGPSIASGDPIYIWTHEGQAFGHGLGLTAKAVAGDVSVSEGLLKIELTQVELLPHPFGFRAVSRKTEGARLLGAMNAHRRLRCWHMAPEDRADFDCLIDAYGSSAAAARAAAEAAHLSPLERAINEHAEAIEQAEEERKTTVVKARPGQQRFRDEAMRRHNGRCVVTGYTIKAVLEAAHVIPHTGASEFEVPENSLVLRRDIHALFDARLMAIHPKSSLIVVSPELATTKYAKALHGRFVDHKLAPEPLIYQYRRFMSFNKTQVSQ